MSIRIGIGLKIAPTSSPVVPPYIWDTDALALFARFTGTPTDATKLLYEKLIIDLKAAGTWTKRDVIVMYCGFDQQASLLNLKSSSFNHTLAGATPPTHTVGQYFQGDGLTGYIRTNYIPKTNGVQFTMDANSWGVRVMNISALDLFTCGARSLTGASHYNTIKIRSGASTTQIINNCVTTLNVTCNAAADLVSDRYNANNFRVMKDGVQLGTTNVVSTYFIDKEFYVGCYNLNGAASNFNTYQFAYYRAGANLSNTEHLAEYTALEYFRTHIVATL